MISSLCHFPCIAYGQILILERQGRTRIVYLVQLYILVHPNIFPCHSARIGNSVALCQGFVKNSSAFFCRHLAPKSLTVNVNFKVIKNSCFRFKTNFIQKYMFKLLKIIKHITTSSLLIWCETCRADPNLLKTTQIQLLQILSFCNECALEAFGVLRSSEASALKISPHVTTNLGCDSNHSTRGEDCL